MIPESHKSGSIRLYRASKFPFGWACVSELLKGPYFVDASVCVYENRWWLFTETNSASKHDTLRLYWARTIYGPWTEHAQSPVIRDNPHIARPAGRIVVTNNQIFRYAQDCFPNYGTQVRAFEVTNLTPTTYWEQQLSHVPVLSKGHPGAWNAHGMHHMDPHPIGDNRWFACVDGHRKVAVTNP